MSSEKNRSMNTGGHFLVETIGSYPIFTREDFSDEHLEIERMVKEFSRERVRENKKEIESFNKDLSLQLIREMGELGLLGVDVPEKYGGMELDKITTAIIAEALSTGFCASFTTTWSVQTGIGSLPIVWFGTPEQKQKYLPKLVSGEWIGGYALTEPSSGSDALAAKTQAQLSDDGNTYLLNGEKQFITNGGWAEVYIVFAQVDGDRISAFIVERNTQGLEVGPEENKMGMKGSSTTSLRLTDARVPKENLLFEVGKGATIAFNALNMGRFKLAASDIGGAKEVINEAVKYALDRRQFGQAIAYFDVIKGKLADMVVRVYSADSMAYRTIGLIQSEIDTLDPSTPDYYFQVGEAMERYAIESSMAKVYGSETLAMCADHGIQILGGYGFIEEFPMAGCYRDTRIDRIWEGTNEINRQIVTGYMMKKALIEELPIRESIRAIDDYLKSDLSPNSDDILGHEVDAIEAGKRLALYLFHEALCEFGQDLRHQQQLTEILANIFIELYTADSTLSRVRQVHSKNAGESSIINIARIHAAEVSLRLLSLSLTGLNGIYKGHLPETVIEHLRNFQVRMLPTTDILGLKRRVAETVYTHLNYPY